MTHDQLLSNQRVHYIPAHAHGNLEHPNVELGVVVRWNARYALVRYFDRDGNLQRTAKATPLRFLKPE